MFSITYRSVMYEKDLIGIGFTSKRHRFLSSTETSCSMETKVLLDRRDEQNSTADCSHQKKEKKTPFTRRQWIILIIICFINVFAAMVYSLQGPFFPQEAEKKGASATVYGLIFGIFELVDFIFCPIYGKFIHFIGPKFLLTAGNFVMASCCILFGFLPQVPAGVPFIALAFAIRIVMALGQAGYFTAWYAIVGQEFPESIATTFSLLETVFGVGLAIGPTVGGFLFQVGGFTLPFTVVGGFLFLAAILASVAFPQIEQSSDRPHGFMKLLRIPSIIICYIGVFAVSYSFGFTQGLLEPHLRQFNLSPTSLGFVFVITGVVYASTAVIWGCIAGKGINPKLLCGCGAILTIISFLLMGPAPFFPMKPQLWIVILALVLQGIGMGGEYVATFVESGKAAVENGFPDNTDTYGLVAGVWTSGFALGTFAGPSLSGVLTDHIGFRSTTQVSVGLHILVAVLNFGQLAYEKRIRSKYENIPSS